MNLEEIVKSIQMNAFRPGDIIRCISLGRTKQMPYFFKVLGHGLSSHKGYEVKPYHEDGTPFRDFKYSEYKEFYRCYLADPKDYEGIKF